jgi:hypothetical protein
VATLEAGIAFELSATAGFAGLYGCLTPSPRFGGERVGVRGKAASRISGG